MRLRLADLGITANPCCSAQRMRICAVDLVSDRWDSRSPGGNCDLGAAGCGPASNISWRLRQVSDPQTRPFSQGTIGFDDDALAGAEIQ